MKLKSLLSAALFFLVLALFSCQDDEAPSQNVLVNNWIRSNMDIVYFWNKELAGVRANKNAAPEDYFYQLLHPDDRFSWITPNAQALRDQLAGHTLSMGYSPAFGKKQASGQYFIIVEYVYENSPAARAGLKRGDIIAAINDQDITPSNFNQLYKQTAYTVTLGVNTASKIERTGTKYSLKAEVLDLNPILHSSVIDYNGVKTGYLAYAEFISGEDEEWLAALEDAMFEMKQSGVSELILDLRYNPGGEVGVAAELASMIAPAAVSRNRETLIKIQYNDLLQKAIEEEEGPDSENLIYKFPATEINLDLDRIFILTASGTASASELLIIGLRPYMNVVQVGEPTVGKFYGSSVFEDKSTPKKHTYAMMPLILKFMNAQGFTDFADGLTPDAAVVDDLLNAKPLGDIEDPVIAAALSIATGGDLARVAPAEASYEKIADEWKLRRGTVMMK